MSSDTVLSEAVKPLRADAQRNYDKLVQAAREAFGERGSDASLDDIAKRAGVGPGTLYRHFPTRDALIDAVMRDWAERVESDSQAVADSGLPPREMLMSWFRKFVENVGIYKGAAAKMMSAMDDESSPIYRKCQILFAANERVLAKASELGALRDDVDPRQVVRLVNGVSAVVDQAGLDADDAEPMLAIILEGILR